LIKRKYQSSTMGDTFNVLVLATMSAGKTSFINALIGEELLHSANEATTACITTLEHDSKRDTTSACCYADNGNLLKTEENIQTDQLKEWNRDHQVNNIVIRGNFNTHCRPAQGLVLHDTPGPNNSQDDRHAQLMLEAIWNTSFDMVFYILNATQLGTNDDSQLLYIVKEELERLQRPCKIVFVLNKVDQLDTEKGETVSRYVEQTYAYLVDAGFTDPVIIPMIASAALYANKKLTGAPLSRKQRLELENFKETCLQDSSALIKASRLPTIVEKNVNRHIQLDAINGSSNGKSELHLLMAYSGLAAVVILINQQRAVVKCKNSQKKKSKHKVSA